MNIQEYQIQAKRTCPSLLEESQDILHMQLGVITELGEVLDVFKKNIAYGKKIDWVNVEEEIADIFWYICNRYTLENKNFPFFDFDSVNFYKPFRLECLTSCDLETLNGFYNVACNLKHLCKEYNLDLEKSLQNNIDKLRVRFPDKFTQEAALNRNLEAERKELEK